jgi:hypothetical protein
MNARTAFDKSQKSVISKLDDIYLSIEDATTDGLYSIEFDENFNTGIKITYKIRELLCKSLEDYGYTITYFDSNINVDWSQPI